MAVKLFRCKICGDGYIGESAPTRCPFCGSWHNFIVEYKTNDITFDVKLSKKDKAFVEKAFQFEISNAQFYFCAAANTPDDEGRILFKTLAKIEAEHANIWKKILKLDKMDIPKSDACAKAYVPNLKESHERETHAVEFYSQAARDADNERIRQIFGAIIQVEQDHLHLSEVRLK